ncbi:uroporphyrinogen-III C-methyltransferase [Spiribacter roseus]|uniref:Uroporphyrinogen-III C-methyltransferase n=1 Tax=Spiribacter roseus TaxID=1855875 RepID=A0ABV3RY97_9GAMM
MSKTDKDAQKALETTPGDDGPAPDDASTAAPAEPAAPATGRGPGRLALVVALLVALLVAAGGGYLIWQMQQLADAQADLAARSELETLRDDQQTALGELNGRVTNLNEQLESRLQSLAQLENRMADQVSARRELADRVDQLYRRMNSETDDWRIAEAGYLARMAVHRVRFNGDIAGALEALEAADVLLSGLGGVGIDRREAIGRAVDQLLDVERIDQVAINRGLDRVADQLGSLPLAAGIQRFETADTTAGARSDAPAEGWQARLDRAGDRLMTGLSELVTVSRDRQVEPLPEPESRFLLQQNLRLQIESARLAALRGEPATYDNALKRIDDWVSAYFDSSAESVSAVRKRLADLMDEPVKVERPAIGETLAPVLNDGGQS